jgi:cytochrome c oxidase subunit 4
MSEQTEHAAHGEAAHGEHEHHITPPVVYVVIFFTLLVFTALTVGFNPIVALAIGVVKATLVVLFFMGVKYSTKLTKLTVFAGLFTFMALIGMTLADYFSRAWGRW